MFNGVFIVRNKCLFLLCLAFALSCGCARRATITDIEQLHDKEFAVPSGTVADQLVLSRFPNAKFQYFNSVLDACMAVQVGKVDAAAYDEPILRNFAARHPGVKVLKGMITVDQYGFAVRLSEPELKQAIDEVFAELKSRREYDDMLARWLPDSGAPCPMPSVAADGTNGVLRFGTAAITEPFSFVDGSHQIVGLDIELAHHIARKLGKKIEVVNMDFGGMIPALVSGKVDIIGACITITAERSEHVLFSVPYYTGGIAALVGK